MKQVVAEVISNEVIMGSYKPPHRPAIEAGFLIWLRCPEIAREARPGQFVMVSCEACDLPRPFSVHRVSGDSLAILYAQWESGKGTLWLSHSQKGNKIQVTSPLGNSFTILPGAQNLLLVAGGMGIAPLIFLAEEAVKKRKSVTLIYGTANNKRTKVSAFPGRLFPSRYPKKLLPFEIRRMMVAVTEDGSLGSKGFATDLIPKFAAKADQVFACGPMGMYREMAQHKNELGLEGKSVQVSLEVRMGCGRGVCYSCTVRTKDGLKQVCQDGPVFEQDEIVWDKLSVGV